MKKLILCALLLSGCSTVKGLFSLDVAPYDALEYSKITQLRTTIVEDAGKCADSTSMKSAAAEIDKQTLELSIYSQGLPGNGDVIAMEQNLLVMTSELDKRYAAVGSVSEVYCDDKLAILMRSAATIQKVIGGKPK